MMISTHAITVILSVLIIQQGFREVICASKFTHFSRVDVLARYECPEGHVLTGEDTSGANYIECAMQCSRLPTCHGIFHHPDTLQCVKCSAQHYTLNDTHVPVTDLLFYTRYNDSVNNDPDVSVYKLVTKLLTWEDAKVYCEICNGSLVIITSADDQAYLEGDVTGEIDANFWIGGDGFATEENFHWIDGTDVFSGYMHWKYGQPHHLTDERTCMKIVSAQDYEWKDADCTRQFRSICEFT